jgi:uncharacterized repeat protein (TIGR03803 family)
MKMQLSGRLALAIFTLVLAWQTPAQAQTLSVLYNFGSESGDPLGPINPGTIAQGRDGNLYSTTPEGGLDGEGAVFRITPAGKLSLPHSFDVKEGGFPSSGLTLTTDGSFYGTAQGPGAGVIFKVTSTGKYTILYELTGADGGTPEAAPLEGTDGNFYGTVYEGGSQALGSVYKLTRSGTFITLYSFDNTHGAFPLSPLVQGSDGNFYGTASQGGTMVEPFSKLRHRAI